VAATLTFSFVVTLVILKVIDAIVGVRVDEEEEVTGLDLSQHAEVGYTFGDRGGSASQTVVVPETPAREKEAVR
jgi:Amt family ammonium transporter